MIYESSHQPPLARGAIAARWLFGGIRMAD
jgi:hypothetical protein